MTALTRKAIPAILAAALVALLGACNTMEGMGEDIESAGDAIEDEADNG